VPIGQLRSGEADLAKLEERIARLERLLHSTVSLVHSLVERERQGRNSRQG
jgi:hypothetical protein